jgi:hypothetical protein
MSKDSWNAQRGCFEPIMDQIHSPSVRKQEAPMSIGTLDTALNYEKVTTPLPSPVANQTTSLNLAAFYHSIEDHNPVAWDDTPKGGAHECALVHG